MKVVFDIDWTHNPFSETHWVSRLRENLTSGSNGEGLETGLRTTLNGHEGGNPGYSQGHSYGLPRQSFTRLVYFKEAKQHLGFLKEQTATFASHTASIHLCAIRYLILMHNKLAGYESRIGAVRSTIQEQLNTLSFAARLWQIFRSILCGALDDLRKTLGCSRETMMELIDERMNTFFVRSLQLDAVTLRLEYE